MKTAQCASADEWMNKLRCVHAQTVKKERSIDARYNMDEPGDHHVKWKEEDTIGHILYCSISMRRPRQANS